MLLAALIRVHDRHERQEAIAHRHEGDVGAADLVGPADPRHCQPNGEGLVMA